MTSAADAARFPVDPLPTEASALGAGPAVPPLRASDADRMAAVLFLQEAVATGCLTPAEGSDRMGAAFAAVHRRDLEPLVADLPRPVGPTGMTGGTRPGDALRARWTAVDPGWRLAVIVAVLLTLTLMVGSVAAHLVLGSGPGGFGGGRDLRFGAGPGGLSPR
jgi:hypothetical protein